MDLLFFAESALMGLGLAMDAFSVSLANGLHEPQMKKGKTCLIAGTFGFFQFAMPMIGWLLVHTVVEQFRAFEKAVPYIALILLCFIGGKMIYEGVKNGNENGCVRIVRSGRRHVDRRLIGRFYDRRIRNSQSACFGGDNSGGDVRRLRGGRADRQEIRNEIPREGNDSRRNNTRYNRHRNFRPRNPRYMTRGLRCLTKYDNFYAFFVKIL